MNSVPQLAVAALASLLLPGLAAAQDFVVTTGSNLTYNTDTGGQITVNRFIIEDGASLRVVGSRPLSITAASVDIYGSLVADGLNASDVGTLNTANVPVPGANGVAGGGAGGTGSPLTNASSPAGTDGGESFDMTFPGLAPGGGQGGETAYAAPSPSIQERGGAGGGGGALAADQPLPGDIFSLENIGLIALPGSDGDPAGAGALSSTSPAAGGLPGLPIFQDANPANDFWGVKVQGTGVLMGELGRPFPGRGGGAGGDAVRSATFPATPFSPLGDEKGAGGGGGGGLVLILTRRLTLGPNGTLSANGGSGGGGENVIFFDRIGGGSGGGSGGWIVLEAQVFDLSLASGEMITAIGGRGGVGRLNRPLSSGNVLAGTTLGAGGNGGPGVIQLHVPSGLESEILLPPNTTLGDLTKPDAHVLLPKLGG